MNLLQVKKVLEENFNKGPSEGKKRSIVFWYDGESEFVDDIDRLELDNAKILKLTNNNSFYIKYLLEKKDTNPPFGIFSFSQAKSRDNGLLDIVKTVWSFNRQGGPHYRGLGEVRLWVKHLRNTCFDNKERRRKFASYKLDDIPKR